MSGEGTACSTHPQRFPISGMLNHAAEVGRCAAQRPLFDPHKGPSSLGCSDRKPSGLSGLLLEKKSAGAKRPPAPQPADSLPVFRNPHLLLEIEADKPRAPTSFPLTSWGRATISQERRRDMKVLGTVVVMGIAAVASLVMSASAGATPHCHGLTATMTGTSGSDNIVGTNHRDVIVARAGHDIVRSRGGRDVICAGRGDDEVAAGARHDRVYGGRGTDELRGGHGADRLFGQRGFDRFLGGGGNDFLSGGFGTDEGFGGSGTDTCRSIEFAHSC